MWKFITGDVYTVSYFVTGWKFIRDVYTETGFHKRRIHCFIRCNWMWKFIRDVCTVSYFVTGYGSL